MSRHSIDPYNPPANPDLVDIDNAAARNLQLEIRTNTVGTVLTFDPATQKAKIRVDPVMVMIDPRSGKEAPFAPFVVTLPVHFPGGGDGEAGQTYISWPIVPGTTGTIHVFDRGIKAWLARIDPTRGYVPEHRSLHQIHDAEFVPGLRTNAFPIPTPVDLTALVLNHATGIKLGRNATLGVARETDPTTPSATMLAWTEAVETAINALAPGTFIPGVSDFAQLCTVVGDMGSIKTASTKVKAE